MFELPYSLFKYLILFNRHHRRPKSVLLERSILMAAVRIFTFQLVQQGFTQHSISLAVNKDDALFALFQYMEISVKELEESPLKEHEHTFFELVYILSGTGLQCINNNKFDYHEGHMFLITPQDCHSFDIHTTTKFFFIRFNDIYIYSFWFLWN